MIFGKLARTAGLPKCCDNDSLWTDYNCTIGNPLIAIPESTVLLIREVALGSSILIEKKPFHRASTRPFGDSGLARNPVAGSVVSHANKAVRNKGDEQ